MFIRRSPFSDPEQTDSSLDLFTQFPLTLNIHTLFISRMQFYHLMIPVIVIIKETFWEISGLQQKFVNSFVNNVTV